MTALTADRIGTDRHDGINFSYPMAASAECFAGALIVLDSSGNAEPGATATGKVAVGRCDEYAIESTAVAAASNVKVKAGVYRWVNSATDAISKAEIGDMAYIEDDNTVCKTATSKSRAGVIVDIDTLGVWVQTGPEKSLVSGLVAANNLSDVGSAATSRSNLGLDTGNSPTFTGVTLTGDLIAGGGAGAITATAAGSSLVCLDNSATGFVMGSSGNPNMLQLVTTTGGEKIVVEGTTTAVAFHVDVGTSLFDEAIAVTGVTTPTGGIAAAGGMAARPGGICHTGGTPSRVSTNGTDATPVNTEVYLAEVFVPCNMSITGISHHNGSNVGTDSRHSALLYSDGTVVVGSATGEDATSGADTYEKQAFTGGAITVIGPATYFIAVIYAASTGRYNAHPFGEFRSGKVTGATYQAITAVTPPTTFTADLGPIASLY